MINLRPVLAVLVFASSAVPCDLHAKGYSNPICNCTSNPMTTELCHSKKVEKSGRVRVNCHAKIHGSNADPLFRR